jgi:hypothetical protein
MKVTKHRNALGFANEMTLHRLTWEQQHLIMDCLLKSKRELVSDHTEEGEAAWEAHSELIDAVLKAWGH